ncbi:MAG: AAA family ATPase, partial [Planctomycetes bacterium]|nr:AAA family ATPase [Planctomycetota bacterium]
MHLKKLELVGFKSFADRTSLDFKPGITGIVGPNGCGKSNVVDAFKWILGSQSAKGLRGTEMMDVIFGGTQNRKPLGYAEVTVVFDNTERYFDIDFSEVAITRRLFRSGESEYLINKNRCRLKDIKNLFLDTGFGATSYSILEQGKIDVLLQATNSDRRVVFEEAAGISKYRLRKAECLRALLRTEDNLDRLQDLIDEVGKRVRRVKAQASKARRYRAYAERIKELRGRIALESYLGSLDEGARLTTSLDAVLAQISELEQELERLAASIELKRGEREKLRGKLQAARDEVEGERIARERTMEKINQADKRYVELVEEERNRKRDLEQTIVSLRRTESQVGEERQKLGRVDSEIERCRSLLRNTK